MATPLHCQVIWTVPLRIQDYDLMLQCRPYHCTLSHSLQRWSGSEEWASCLSAACPHLILMYITERCGGVLGIAPEVSPLRIPAFLDACIDSLIYPPIRCFPPTLPPNLPRSLIQPHISSDIQLCSSPSRCFLVSCAETLHRIQEHTCTLGYILCPHILASPAPPPPLQPPFRDSFLEHILVDPFAETQAVLSPLMT